MCAWKGCAISAPGESQPLSQALQSGEELLACDQAGITIAAQTDHVGRQGQGPVWQAGLCLSARGRRLSLSGERLKYYFTNVEDGLSLRHYWTNACRTCALKSHCTTTAIRRIKRWEHEHVIEAVQKRLDENPQAMRTRRETVEHPFGTIKARMGTTHFLMNTLPRVASEMALHVLAYNLTRVRTSSALNRFWRAMRA
jgi:Transposase DDE domain